MKEQDLHISQPQSWNIASSRKRPGRTRMLSVETILGLTQTHSPRGLRGYSSSGLLGYSPRALLGYSSNGLIGYSPRGVARLQFQRVARLQS